MFHQEASVETIKLKTCCVVKMGFVTDRIKTLNKENCDTWRIQAETPSIKNDARNRVNETTVKPGLVPIDTNFGVTVRCWSDSDNKVKWI